MSAARAAPADGPFYTCADHGSSTVYSSVGGALIWVHSWNAMRADASAGTTTPVTCAGMRITPSDGTIAQSSAGGSPQATYVLVGGAPLLVRSWGAIGLSGQPTSVAYFDAASLPTGDTEQTSTGEPADDVLAGYFITVVRNGYFRSLDGTYYRTDYAGHPVILPGKPANHAAPIVDQASIASCERMDCDPWGDISVDVVGEGRIHVSGYALDGMATRPLTVRLDVAGQSLSFLADQPDASINTGYGIAGNYGFDRVLSVPAGHYDLCTTFVGYAPGGTTDQAGCQVVDVPGAKPGKVGRPTVRAKGHGRALITWKAPATHGSPISEYVVKIGHKREQLPGTAHRLVVKHLRVGHVVTVRVRAINGVGYGPYSKGSTMVRIR